MPTDYGSDPMRLAVMDALLAAGANGFLLGLMVTASTSRPIAEFAASVAAELDAHGLRLEGSPQILVEQYRATVLDLTDRQCTAVVTHTAAPGWG